MVQMKYIYQEVQPIKEVNSNGSRCSPGGFDFLGFKRRLFGVVFMFSLIRLLSCVKRRRYC